MSFLFHAEWAYSIKYLRVGIHDIHLIKYWVMCLCVGKIEELERNEHHAFASSANDFQKYQNNDCSEDA